MVEDGKLSVVVIFFACLALVTALMAFNLPMETAGKKLDGGMEVGNESGAGHGGQGGGGEKVGDVELSRAVGGVAASS